MSVVIAWFTGLPAGVLALLGTIVGGVVLKYADKVLSRNAERRADRQDYRLEIKELQERLDVVEDQLTEWRNKYYAAQEQIMMLKAMVIGAGLNPPD